MALATWTCFCYTWHPQPFILQTETSQVDLIDFGSALNSNFSIIIPTTFQNVLSNLEYRLQRSPRRKIRTWSRSKLKSCQRVCSQFQYICSMFICRYYNVPFAWFYWRRNRLTVRYGNCIWISISMIWTIL